MNDLYLVIFNINKYDLLFSFSYRKLCKEFKKQNEYWLTSIYTYEFLDDLYIHKFVNLKSLDCATNVNNTDLYYLPKLKNVDISLTESISNIALNKLNNLKCLRVNNRITSSVIKNKKIYQLDILNNNNITEDSLKKMNLYSLNNNEIINSLQYFYLFSFDSNYINTNNSIKHMFLHSLSLYDNEIINSIAIIHMQLYKFITNDNIYDNSIKHMNLHTLSINNNITSEYLKNNKLHTISINFYNDINVEDCEFYAIYNYKNLTHKISSVKKFKYTLVDIYDLTYDNLKKIKKMYRNYLNVSI